MELDRLFEELRALRKQIDEITLMIVRIEVRQ